MTIHWLQIAPSVTAAFLASLVEFVEALTIVLAVGSTRGWRPALLGTGLGVFALFILVAIFGPALQTIPLDKLQLVIGVLLLLFGMRWLRKAILRSSGLIPLHDEEKIFHKETAQLKQAGFRQSALFQDPVAVMTSFKAVVLEGLEVVFIVIATSSASKSLFPATFGAALAGLLVLILGVVVHKPLSTIPENQLKFTVGLLLSAFGAFWIGEGLGYPWPGEDLFIIALAGLFFVTALLGIKLTKKASVVRRGVR